MRPHLVSRILCTVVTLDTEASKSMCMKLRVNIVMCTSDYRRVLIGFIDNLQIVTRSNYDTIANFHTSQITTATPSLFNLLCLHQPFPGNDFYHSSASALTSLLTAPTKSSHRLSFNSLYSCSNCTP
jgi:hypothetical protein